MVDNREERSALWSTSAWGSLMGGAGYGVYKSYPELKSAILTGNRDITSETVKRLEGIGSFNVNPRLQRNINNIDGFMLQGLSDTSGGRIQNDIANATYRSILAGGQMDHADASVMKALVLSQGSAEDAYGVATGAIRKAGGAEDMFASSMQNLGDAGYYDKERMAEFSNAVMPNEDDMKFSAKPRQSYTMRQLRTELGDEAYDNAMDFGQRLNKSTGGELNFNTFNIIDDVVDGKQVRTPVMSGRIGPQQVSIPLLDTGVTYGGENLTSRYLTRESFNATDDNLEFVDRYVAQIEGATGKHSSVPGMNDAVRGVDRDLLDITKSEQSRAMSQAVWTLPEEVASSGDLATNRLTRMQTVWTGEGDLSEDMVGDMISKGRNVFPYGSPDTVAKGTMMTSDIAVDLFGHQGRLMSPDKRPTQFFKEWGVTAESKNIAAGMDGTFAGEFGNYYDRLDRKTQGLEYKNIVYGGLDAADEKAFSSPQLTTFYAKPESLESGNLANAMFEEEMLISEKATRMMEHERIVQKKIILDNSSEINKSLMGAARGKSLGEVFTLDNTIDNGQFLGIERGSGKELFSSAENGIGRVDVLGGQMTGANEMTIFQRERQVLEGNEWWKFFSEDVKFMGRQRSDAEMMEVMNLAGINKNRIAGQDIEAIVNGKLVQRNKMAMMEQQTEALSMIAADKLTRGELNDRNARLAEQLLKNPSRKLGVSRLSKLNDIAAAELKIQTDMVGIANKLGFSEEELGLTFGMVDSERASALGIENAVDQSKGVIGLSKMRLGDKAYGGGSGNLGSMEATGFRSLAMKGDEGQMFAAELSGRRMGKVGLQEVDKMTASMIGTTPLKEKARLAMDKIPTDKLKLGQMTEKNMITDQGRYVDIGRKLDAFGGSSKIYVPGKNEEFMKRKLVNSGKLIDSPISKDLGLLRKMIASGASDKELEPIAKRLRNSAFQESESIAAGGGKILGSKYLTGIRQTAKESGDNTFRISQKSGLDMFGDLYDRAKTDKEKKFIDEQKNLFLKGKTLQGGSWRHPTTGPESFQFVNYRMDESLSDGVMSVPMKRAKLKIDGQKSKTVDVSQMTGMKGDFDRDQFNIAAITNRDTADRVSKKMTKEIGDDYTKYAFNHYAMKGMMGDAKNNIPNAFSKDGYVGAMKSGMRDLTTAKIATPQVNVALQKAKLGLQHSAPEKYRPLAELFFHLEEAAISKHGSYEGEIYQDIGHAIKQKDAGTMENVLRHLMGDARTVKGTLGGQANSLDYDPGEWSRQIIDAAEAAGPDVDYAQRSAQAAKGNMNNIQLNDMIAMNYGRRQGSIDVLPSLVQAQNYGKEGFEQGANRLLRKAQTKSAAITKALRSAKVPAMIGGAVAAGVMLSSPSTSGSLSTGREGARSGRNMGPGDMGPPRGVKVNPPQPRIMASPKTYDMTGIGSSSRANINMSMSDADSSSSAFMRQVRMLSESGSANIRTSDDRNVLNAQRLANKIHERL